MTNEDIFSEILPSYISIKEGHLLSKTCNKSDIKFSEMKIGNVIEVSLPPNHDKGKVE